jgi:hypothetical protein
MTPTEPRRWSDRKAYLVMMVIGVVAVLGLCAVPGMRGWACLAALALLVFGIPLAIGTRNAQHNADTKQHLDATGVRGIVRIHGLEQIRGASWRFDATLELPGQAPHRGAFRCVATGADRRNLAPGAERPALVAPGNIFVYPKASPAQEKLSGYRIMFWPLD